MKCTLSRLTFMVAVALLPASCNKNKIDQVLKRDTDAISIAYNQEASNKVSVRYAGKWSAASDASWLKLTPENAIGNGQDYIYLIATAERNLGDKRSCKITITPENGKEAIVMVTQEEGFLVISNPAIKGVLKKEEVSNAYISIPYKKGLKDGAVEVNAVLSGASAGLEIENPVKMVMEEKDGEMLIPVKGTATSSGELTISLSLSINGKEYLKNELKSNVKDNTVAPVIKVLSAPEVSVFDSPSCYYGIIKIKGYDNDENTNEFQLVLEENGKEIQSYTFGFSEDNKLKYAKNGINFQFSSLKPAVNYTAKVKRMPIDTERYKESEFGTVVFTTVSEPDKSSYLLWQDFDNHPWGGNGPLLAFGIVPSEKHKEFDVINGVSSKWNLATPVKNMDNLCTGVGVAGAGASYYHSTYMVGWDDAELTANRLTKTVYLCAGMMKFGTGSSSGILTLPVFDKNSLTITFDAAPYTEPNKTTGLLEESPSIENGVDFYVELTGAGSIMADGESVTGTKAKLKNKTARETSADTKGFLPYTSHTIKISGMNKDTRICIKTLSKKDGRMWLDNLKVKAE